MHTADPQYTAVGYRKERMGEMRQGDKHFGGIGIKEGFQNRQNTWEQRNDQKHWVVGISVFIEGVHTIPPPPLEVICLRLFLKQPQVHVFVMRLVPCI